MTITTYGYHKKAYIAQLKHWAESLGATEMTVHYDSSVTLTCKDGGICHNYQPSPQELVYTKKEVYQYETLA